MNLSRMTEDVSNITVQPNQFIGKAADLKKLFDKSGVDIKDFINNTLIPELEKIKLSEITNDGNGSSPFATTEEVAQAIANLVDSSPDALDTLKELADALGNDPEFSTTVLNLIGAKVDKTTYEEEKAEIEEKLNNLNLEDIDIDLPIEQGKGTLSLQSKEWVGDEDEEPRKCSAEGLGDVSLGLGCYTNGKAAIALGKLTSAPVSYATALGLRTTALSNRSTIFGYSTISAFFDAGITENSTVDEIIASWIANSANFSLVKGVNSNVFGKDCLALGNTSTSGGAQAVAYSNYSISNGYMVTAMKAGSSANGWSSGTVFSVIPGLTENTSVDDIYNAWLSDKFNLAFGAYSLTNGYDCLTLDDFTQVFGRNNVGFGKSLFVAGYNNHIKGYCATGFGQANTIENSDNAFIGGYKNKLTSAPGSIGFGYSNVITSSNYASIFGYGNTLENSSHSMTTGRNNTLENASCSIVFGKDNVLKGEYTSIFGYNNVVNNNHNGILGLNNKINAGTGSFIVGNNNVVNYSYSQVLGRGLIANKSGTYLGQYNTDSTDSNLQFAIGKGTSDTARANLMEYRKTKDTLDIYAKDVKFNHPDGTNISVYNLLERLAKAEATIAKLTEAVVNLGGTVVEE